jgi:hypothetical protein
MVVIERIGRVLQLAGVVAVAAGSLALAMCSRAPHQDTTPDAQTSGDGSTEGDGAVDAGPPEGGVDATLPTDGSADRPDARLWDVLCE